MYSDKNIMKWINIFDQFIKAHSGSTNVVESVGGQPTSVTVSTVKITGHTI